MYEAIKAKNIGYIDNNVFDLAYLDCDIEMPSICPRCNRAVVPQVLDSYILKYPNDNVAELTTMFFCRGCEKVFLGNYFGKFNEYNDNNIMKIQYLSPFSEQCSVFSDAIRALSTEFVMIFNQAENAENGGLDKICGIAYRKALEYLVKDFAVYSKGNKIDEIKSKLLGKCIDEYIDNEKIKKLAKAAVWIGNDETHYERKHIDYSIVEMKSFIKAMVTYIDSELQVLEAEKLLNG